MTPDKTPNGTCATNLLGERLLACGLITRTQLTYALQKQHGKAAVSDRFSCCTAC